MAVAMRMVDAEEEGAHVFNQAACLSSKQARK